MALEKLMSKDVTSLPERASIMDAAKFMTDMNVGSVVVVDGGKPLGLLTDRDIITKVVIEGKDPSRLKLSDVMTRPAISIAAHKEVSDATKLMSEAGVRRLPVVDGGGKLVGVVSLDDILLVLGDEMEDIANTLRCELGKK